MKNFKNIAFGLVAGMLAFGFSAFTNAKAAAGDVYAQTGSGTYQRISNPGAYNPSSDCTPTSSSPCVFVQPASDTNDHGDVLTINQAQDLELSPSSDGTYIGPF
ncbi:hypothetical protein [Pedobacter sp. GR22-6]|uniref:hypothetical protein n=1 Tax=Pedobacter sp. GR22-6 TaxID=3127957 RepID=UPI00307F6FCF